MAKRGFFAELQYQNQQAAKRQAQARARAQRERDAASRQAAKQARDHERARAQNLRATAAEQKAAEKEAARLHLEVMNAEADARNEVLLQEFEEIDGILTAALSSQSFVNLEELRAKVDHPPFDPQGLDVPTLAPPMVVAAPEPQYVEPPPSKGAVREETQDGSDFLMKVQEEKERARDERERLRQERKAAQELAAEREQLDKERAHLQNALDAIQNQGDEAAKQDLLEKIEAVDSAIAHNDFRAAHIRAGYVYVISNEGSFGKNMVKIALTRRLEPEDRVRELSGASVPFPFDIHALFFSEDAVSLETELHHIFSAKRVNHVNERREFFFASPQEVREVLADKVGNLLLEFTEDVDATQFRQSRSLWPVID